MNKTQLIEIFKNRNFKLLFFGEAISNIGDQFTFISLAWLVVSMTNSSVAVGIVLALSGFPRAIFMLFSGTFVDRFSPRKIMLVSNIARFFVVSLLAILVLTGAVRIWMIYTIALSFGIFDAFFIPARVTLVPKIVSEGNLGIGNTLVHGLSQLSQFIGPFLVGSFIGYIENKTHSYYGIGIAMIFDAITFLVSMFTLLLMSKIVINITKNDDIINMITSGFLSVWNNVGLRFILFSATLINFLLIGPLLVGMPIFAKNNLLGAYSYGYIMSAWGIGALIGYFLAGFVFKPKYNSSIYLLSVATMMGILFSLFTYAGNSVQYIAISFLTGITAGYVMIFLLTMVQKNTPSELMGRTMSTVLFCSIGLNPVSELIAGNVINKYGSFTFQYAGLFIAIVALSTMLIPKVRNYGNQMLL